jgi:hypothetical protein
MRRLSWLASLVALTLYATLALCTSPASATPITLGFNFTSTPNSELSAWPSGANIHLGAAFGSMPLHLTLFPDLNAGGAPFATVDWGVHVDSAFGLGGQWSDSVGSYTVAGDSSYLDAAHYPYILAGFVQDGVRHYTDNATLFSVTDVPEPSTLGLISLGLLGLGAMRRRRRYS